jgi:glucosamine--fructose-6-phosphate aminotransferase (isomerizing)
MDTERGEPVTRDVKTISWDAAMAEKAGYRHFMLKEIFEQPHSITNTFRGRVDVETGAVRLPEIDGIRGKLSDVSRIILLACGTSWHAGLVAKYWFEKWFGVPVEVDLASEFRYRHIIMDSSVLVIPISQSGETADTLAGMKKARETGALVVSICNVVGSTVTRESDATIYTHAGPEISVASTKAFTSQLTALYLLGLWLADLKEEMDVESLKNKISALVEVPMLVEQSLERWREQASKIAERFYKCNDFLFLGRDVNFPVALEGALKLKEISYIHAEGYAAGEMKHGPIALIDHNMPVVAIAPRDHVYEKVVSNMEEVRSRRGIIITVGEEDAEELKRITEHNMTIPAVSDNDITPFVTTVPLQLLAYETACIKGCDVDQPRNLAKSVTVE